MSEEAADWLMQVRMRYRIDRALLGSTISAYKPYIVIEVAY